MLALALAASLACPQAGETVRDCPWASIAREAAQAADALAVLRSSAPAVVAEVESDARAPELLALWGKSVNFDEHAKAVIVAPKILDALLSLAKAGPGHAGIAHCYGYLFSTLKTPFGFKRERWTSGVVENGFRLEPGTFSPVPANGTLLRNVTAFAGRIAFRTDARELAAASKLAAFDVSDLKPRRLTEAAGTVTIRTDYVPYRTGRDGWLVYSWRDEKAGRAYLITAFPVEAKFADALFAPKGLGERKTVVSRYNADIPGVTGATGLAGTRQAE